VSLKLLVVLFVYVGNSLKLSKTK